MSLEMGREKCERIENMLRTGSRKGESTHCLLSTCKFFHLFIESLHNQSADASGRYDLSTTSRILRLLQSVKIVCKWTCSTQCYAFRWFTYQFCWKVPLVLATCTTCIKLPWHHWWENQMPFIVQWRIKGVQLVFYFMQSFTHHL